MTKYEFSNKNSQLFVANESQTTDSTDKQQLLNKSSSHLSFVGEVKTKKIWKKESSNAINNSIISLHIAAYEDSLIGAAFDLVDDENVALKRNKIDSNNRTFPGSFVHNLIQQEEHQAKKPEVAGFRTSQRLLDSDQPSQSNTVQIPTTVVGSHVRMSDIFVQHCLRHVQGSREQLYGLQAGSSSMLPPTSAYPKIPPNLKGVKHSRTTNTTSCGLESLDKLVEDGIPFPSIILIDEKCDQKVGKILQRIFVAEGLTQGQNVVVATPRKQDIEDLLNSIPSETASTGTASGSGSSQKTGAAAPEENLKIAWRFQSAPQINSSVSNSKPKYDLAKSRARMEVNESELIQTIYANSYEQLWKELQVILDSAEVEIVQTGSKTAHRIILSDLGSPLFLDHSTSTIASFLTHLRAYVMSSCSVVMLVIDGPNMKNEILETFHLCSDSILNFHPNGENSNDAYAGRLEIAKIPRLYGGTPFRPEFCDYTYKDTRHTLEIRKLHLNFDDSDNIDQSSVQPITEDLREMGILASVADED
uniref:Elongator complex protein 4 n=1 Tax=Panagrolaimus sp. PS1159 TaxID=55785 RepID=A0AC35G908_9BILA